MSTISKTLKPYSSPTSTWNRDFSPVGIDPSDQGIDYEENMCVPLSPEAQKEAERYMEELEELALTMPTYGPPETW
jgi:hypothetical protein